MAKTIDREGWMVPEEIKKRIIEKIKKTNPKELLSHKTQIERETESYKKGFTQGYIYGYLAAEGENHVSEIPKRGKKTK